MKYLPIPILGNAVQLRFPGRRDSVDDAIRHAGTRENETFVICGVVVALEHAPLVPATVFAARVGNQLTDEEAFPLIKSDQCL